MSKKSLLILFVLPFFFACKKGDGGGTAVDKSYIINGIHDIDLTNQDEYILPVTLELQDNKNQQNVALSVEGLPEGVAVDIQPANGIPTFASVIKFTNNYTSPGGKYPIKIVGTSQAGKKQYDVNLTLSGVDGWAFSGKRYGLLSLQTSKKEVMVNPNNSQDTLYVNNAGIYCVSDKSGIAIEFSTDDVPKVEGRQYQFKTAGYMFRLQKEDEVLVAFGMDNSYFYAQPGQNINIKYSNAKYTLTGTLNMVNVDDDKDIRRLVINIKQ